MDTNISKIPIREHSRSRIVGLDILRILLAVLIYMFHSWMHIGCSYSYLDDFVSVGAIAMTGFFMLSGYALRLVYGDKDILSKRDIGRFYVKRLLSIIPLYYFCALLYVLICDKGSVMEKIFLFPIEALGLQTTLVSLSDYTHNSGTWFISCILLAYLIYPFLQAICKMLAKNKKIIVLLILMAIDIYGAIASHKFDTSWTYENPFYRIVEFTCGLLIADINMEYDGKLLKIIRSRVLFFCSVIVLLTGVSLIRHNLHFDDYMLYNVIVLPCFTIMLFALGTIKMPLLERSKAISYCSKLSYVFFLVQLFMRKVVKWELYYIGYDSNILRILLSFSYCIIASVLIYELVQKPITLYVNKILYKNNSIAER